MNIILFDDEGRSKLLPMVYTRPCGDLRVGILTLAEKWEILCTCTVSYLTEDYLASKYPANYADTNYYVNGRLLADKSLLKTIVNLQDGEKLVHDGCLVAFRCDRSLENINDLLNYALPLTPSEIMVSSIAYGYDLFSLNGQEIKKDFILLTTGRKSAALSETNTLIGTHLFIEEGVSIEATIINTTEGPVYIGKNSIIMEGSLIRGPFSLGEGSTIKMGAKIYGDTTVGPQCKVGGEVSNSVFYGNSNKGHDGFLGNSVIGEWCNLGAGTNSSNLKNNYAPVKLWNYDKGRFINSGLQFCGLIMGDHSKCGINTMFNTGTVVGVSANIFGTGFPRNFIPSFTWGGASGFTTYALAKVLETSRIVMLRRNIELDEIEKNILKNIFEASEPHRFWENKTPKI
jgi:UDP-N-acetylglucosamine diphosphorylase/glucosamine-1-phosphate N-acetyltransferase